MYSRTPFALVIACAVLASLACGRRADAIDRFWQGDVNGFYGGVAGDAGNWNSVSAGTSPRSAANERAVIGTDSPSGELNSNLAPNGSPTQVGGASVVGGIALGLRVIDYFDEDFDGMTNDFLHDDPPPAPGTLIGALTLESGAVLQTQTTSDDFIGANGDVLVGVHGRGYLTMNGDSRLTINNAALSVGGENTTTDAGTAQELGPSLVDLSDSAMLVTNGANGLMDLNRRLRITGPSVTLSATGRVRFVPESSYTAAITDASAHSSIHSDNNVLLAGRLAVEFSGAAAQRDPVASLGTTWTLADSSLSDNAIDGNFANLGPGGLIEVAGIDTPPLGANYRVKKVAVGDTSELQLSYEQTLVLTVNRDTGELSVRNPLSGDIAIDSYSVRSARGSLLPSYDGLGDDTPNAGNWVVPPGPNPSGDPPFGANTVNALSEVREPDPTPPSSGDDSAYDLSAVSSVSLGAGFSRTGVAADAANFGFDGEDLIFEFSGPDTDGAVLRGQVEYVGTKFENDLVLRVNPDTGQAFIKNDSLETLTLDGYSILASEGGLESGQFIGLEGDWEASDEPTANAISEVNLFGATTLPPDDEVFIGAISTNALTVAEQEGLTIQYILAEGLGPAQGADYNEDGVIDAADYAFWRDNLGASITLPNQDPAAATPSLVDGEDYEYWRARFGATLPETEFRTGSVVFETSASAGPVAGAVPEPGAGFLMLVGLGMVVVVRRSGKRRTQPQLSRSDEDGATSLAYGAITMSFSKWALRAAMAGVFAAVLAPSPAAAVTQGIPLTNGDFSEPGPFGTKVVAFDEDGVPFAPTDPVITLSSGQLAGGIPGWTFTGGSGIEATGEINAGLGNELFGDDLPGDSGTEGVGGGAADNEMLLSTFDGRAFQTSSFNVTSISATEKYQITFDARNIFTPGETIDDIGPMAQLTARLYYVDAGSAKQTIGTPLVIDSVGPLQQASIEFNGDNPGEMALLAPAMGRPIGIEFDTTSFEADPLRVERSWIGIDNVIMQITGIKRGDLDGDGAVDLDDFAMLRNNLQEAHTYEFQGELTGDYMVDLNDFRAFKTLYEADNPGAPALPGLAAPEPSSFALLAVTAAALIGASRRRNQFVRARALAPVVVTIGTLLFAAADAKAVQFAYDPFLIGENPASGEYTVTTFTTDDPPVAVDPLAGQNPTIGPATPSFFRDGWALGSEGQVVTETGLSYLGAPSPGGAVNGFGRTARFLNDTGNPLAVWDDSTEGTFYLSVVANFGTIAEGGDMGYRAIEFFPADVDEPGENRIGDIGYNEFFSSFGPAQRTAATAKMQFNLYGQQIIDSAPESYNEDGLTHLLVLKWVFSTEPESDSISLFLNPTSVEEPVLPSAVVTGIDASLGSFGAASFGSEIAGPTTMMDDIRVGDTFADVLPDLPLPGDVNGDEVVDLLDYEIIISHMNLTGVQLSHGDVTGDGRVTIADYRFWKDRRTDLALGAVGNAHVPEPGGLALILAAVPACCRRHQRRRLGSSNQRGA